MESSSGTDIIPEIIPCCYGKEVGVEPEIISTGLSAISIKRTTKNKSGMGGNQSSREKSSFENRNSFFNLHRPEMTKINWVSTSPRKIEQFFHDHATKHGPFCAYLHDENASQQEEFKCILPVNDYDYDEEEFLGVSGSMGNSVLLKSCSIQLSDEDLSPSNVCHRSRAEFCVTIGGTDLPRFTHTVSQTMTDTLNATPSPDEERKGSLPMENEDLLSPLTDTQARVQKVAKSAPRSAHTESSLALRNLSSIGQSTEIAAITPINDSKTGTQNGTDDTTDQDTTEFRSILEPTEEPRSSLPNKMTEADDNYIESLQKKKTDEQVARPDGRGNYNKTKPAVTAADSSNKK